MSLVLGAIARNTFQTLRRWVKCQALSGKSRLTAQAVSTSEEPLFA